MRRAPQAHVGDSVTSVGSRVPDRHVAVPPPVPAPAPLPDAFRDDALPHLALLLDEARMRERFASRYLTHEAAGWTLERCTVEDASHRHGRHCGILYRLGFRSPEGERTDEWVYGKAYAPELARPRFEKALGNGAHGARPLRPFLGHVPALSFWTDLDLSVTVFPHDRKMPSLRRALDPRRVRWEIETHAGLLRPDLDPALASSGLLECTRLDLQRVKYMAGKRCVVRYRALLEGAPDGVHEVAFFAKTYAIGRGSARFQAHRRASQQLRAQGAAVDLPVPLLYLDDLDTAWMVDWNGRPLLDSIGEPAWSARSARAAEFIAAFHRSTIEGIPSGRTPSDMLEAAVEDGFRLSASVPALHSVVARIRDRLEARRSLVDSATGPRTPIHGACRAEQMLFQGDRVTLVDFDGLAIGDPLHDVAEWIVSLEFLAIRAGHDAAELERTTAAFLCAYQASVPWTCDRRRIAWYALASLLPKMAGVVKHLDAAALHRLLARADTLAARWIEEIR